MISCVHHFGSHTTHNLSWHIFQTSQCFFLYFYFFFSLSPSLTYFSPLHTSCPFHFSIPHSIYPSSHPFLYFSTHTFLRAFSYPSIHSSFTTFLPLTPPPSFPLYPHCGPNGLILGPDLSQPSYKSPRKTDALGTSGAL